MGGLYLLFAREIVRGGFALPAHIPYYTAAGLPYAYPPLAFYVEALVLRLLALPTFVVVNGLPALLSCLTVGAFFLLAREFLAEDRWALLATAVYALLPAAFYEHLAGEGLVESLGTLFFILGVLALVRLNRQPSWLHTVLLGVLIGLNVLASPGGAYGLAVSVAVLWLLRAGGRRAHLGYLVSAGGIGLVLSAPYWLTVALRNGPAIFYRTFFSQHAHLFSMLAAKLGFLVQQQLPLSPWGVLALIGLAVLLARREWALPLWCLAVYAIPREFGYLVAVPLALLATCSITDVLLPGAAGQGGTEEQQASRPRRPAVVGILLVVLFTWGLVRAVAWGQNLARERDLVSVDEIAAMDWIRENTPPQSTFLVIGDEIEWFPVLSERTTLNVIWGSEWVADQAVFQLSTALEKCRTPACYLQSARSFNLAPDYLYLSHSLEQEDAIGMARQDPGLELTWENAAVVLFKVRPPGGATSAVAPVDLAHQGLTGPP
jgi:hypothetical protein